MALAHFRMLIHELLKKDPDIVPEESPLILLDGNSDMCMAKNGKDTKHTRHISRRIHLVRNGEKCKINSIDWCEGGLQLADIATKNVGEPDLTRRMKYTMDTGKLRHNNFTIGVTEYRIVYITRVMYDYNRLSLGLDSVRLKYL